MQDGTWKTYFKYSHLTPAKFFENPETYFLRQLKKKLDWALKNPLKLKKNSLKSTMNKLLDWSLENIRKSIFES